MSSSATSFVQSMVGQQCPLTAHRLYTDIPGERSFRNGLIIFLIISIIFCFSLFVGKNKIIMFIIVLMYLFCINNLNFHSN